VDAAYAAALYIEYDAANLIKSRRASRGIYMEWSVDNIVLVDAMQRASY